MEALMGDDTSPLVQAVLEALAGQECTVVRDSYAEQLVIGFGSPSRADWPLRSTSRAPWLVYSRYGGWLVGDGDRKIASDEKTLNDRVLQRIRAVLLHQHVQQVDFDSDAKSLAISLENGAEVRFGPSEGVDETEELWALEAPSALLIEARLGGVSVKRHAREHDETGLSKAAALHRLVRHVAELTGLALLEPPPSAGQALDAILAAPDGKLLLVQFKLQAEPPRVDIRTIVVGDEAREVGSTELPLPELTPATMAARVRRILSAA